MFSAFIALSWHYNPLQRLTLAWLARQIYPIDKTNIDTSSGSYTFPGRGPGWCACWCRPMPPSCAGRSSTHFAGAGNSRCLYSHRYTLVFPGPDRRQLLRGRSLLSRIDCREHCGHSRHVRGRLCGDVVQERGSAGRRLARRKPC
jgi:hypothetical protein